jgi:hypothetical protein
MSAAVRHHLEQAWLASLDADPQAWHLDPFAHIVFEIGRKFDKTEPDRLNLLVEGRLGLVPNRIEEDTDTCIAAWGPAAHGPYGWRIGHYCGRRANHEGRHVCGSDDCQSWRAAA